MVRKPVAAVMVVCVLAVPGFVACDSEDVKDVKEGVEDIKEGAEEGAQKIEHEIDKADTDGKDDK